LWYNNVDTMPSILSFSGEKLLDPAVLNQIKEQADFLLKNRDVAGAWQAANHIKSELKNLDGARVQPVLPDYRIIATRLKALALPLLEEEDVLSILKNNLDYIDETTDDLLISGLRVWLASQPEQEQDQLALSLSASVPKGNKLYQKIQNAIGAPNNDANNASGANSAAGPREDLFVDNDKVFDEDEVMELSMHLKKAQDVGQSALAIGDLEKVSRQLLNLANSPESKENFLSRASALIKSRLRDVRTAVNIREYFSRPFAVGGLGLAGNILESAVSLVENYYKKTHQPSLLGTRATADKSAAHASTQAMADRSAAHMGTQAMADRSAFAEQSPAPKVSSLSPSTAPLPTPTPAPAIAKAPIAPAKIMPKQPLARSPIIKKAPVKQEDEIRDSQVKTEKDAQTELDKLIRQSAPAPAKSPVPRSLPGFDVISRPQTQNYSKPRMEDVRQSPGKAESSRSLSGGLGSSSRINAVGLSEELSLMTLEEFRRLGGAQEAQDQILHKLSVLEGDSFMEKHRGIQKFRESELYKQYLKIGEQSLSLGKKLNEVLADKTINPDGITEDEFFSIANLNSRLK